MNPLPNPHLQSVNGMAHPRIFFSEQLFVFFVLVVVVVVVLVLVLVVVVVVVVVVVASGGDDYPRYAIGAAQAGALAAQSMIIDGKSTPCRKGSLGAPPPPLPGCQ